jgi:hypothetical protein
MVSYKFQLCEHLRVNQILRLPFVHSQDSLFLSLCDFVKERLYYHNFQKTYLPCFSLYDLLLLSDVEGVSNSV